MPPKASAAPAPPPRSTAPPAAGGRSTGATAGAGAGAAAGGAAGRARVAKSLRDVYEESCRASDVHVNSALARFFPERHGAPLSVDTLDLSRNFVGDRGLIPVLAVIQRSPHLRKLVLCENGLRNNAVKLLCNVCVKHPSIVSVDLSDNFISEGAGNAIEQLLAENPRITDVGFRNTKIDSHEQRLRIKELISRNIALRDQEALAEATAKS
jgi:hypothetical protein